MFLLSSEAIDKRVLQCDISDITDHSIDIYLSVLGHSRYHLRKNQRNTYIISDKEGFDR